MGEVTVLQGCSLEMLKLWPSNSVDSCVTDPPYALVSIVKRFGGANAAPVNNAGTKAGRSDDPYARASAGFMGQTWDTGEVAFAVEFWAEVLRVLKPGGHVLAFSGSRTYHRLACAIEDAGFEIRDQIMWLYGSGFPKSHDVSKGIDKVDAADARRARQLRFTEWVRSTGLTAARINEITGTGMGRHYATEASQPSVATREFFEMLRPHFGESVPQWVEDLVHDRTVESENFKRRAVIGTREKLESWNYKGNNVFQTGGDAEFVTITETSAHTPEARQWQGWGTALKPAHEPIVMARKPLIGTVAANVLEYGTGALNIDASRIPTEGERISPRGSMDAGTDIHEGWARPWMGDAGKSKARLDVAIQKAEQMGRWPANVIHDGSDEVVAGFPNDNARFFYCAKAGKKDRGPDNTHPTVKPRDLMAYLCRLVTPPGGLVLDPFAGSGSTGLAARAEGFNALLIEREAKYVEIIHKRLTATSD